jgi:hypothetical protein
MKITTMLTALALSLAPVAAFAQGCAHGTLKGETASSCLPGYSWDAATSACITTPSS